MNNFIVKNNGYWCHYLLYFYIQISYQVEKELYMVTTAIIYQSTSGRKILIPIEIDMISLLNQIKHKIIQCVIRPTIFFFTPLQYDYKYEKDLTRFLY